MKLTIKKKVWLLSRYGPLNLENNRFLLQETFFNDQMPAFVIKYIFIK